MTLTGVLQSLLNDLLRRHSPANICWPKARFELGFGALGDMKLHFFYIFLYLFGLMNWNSPRCYYVTKRLLLWKVGGGE